jgi:hypothetical protein
VQIRAGSVASVDAYPLLGRAGSVAAVMLAAMAIVVAQPVPASAHTVSGPKPTNYRTTLRSVTPRVPGISVRVVELGNKLELTNRTPTDVLVLGYDGEPYLRVGPHGVYTNLRSKATYLNRTRAGTTPVPDIALRATAQAAPRWRRISAGHTAIWHDHRIHWMGTAPPPAVQRDPGSFHRVKARWTVPLRYGDRPVAVVGRLDWVPGPGGWPWLPVVVVLGIAGFAAAFRKPRGTAIAAIVGMVGVDLVHSITAEVARAGTQLAKTVQFFGDNFVSVLVWIAAVLVIRGLRRGDVVARYGMVLIGAMVALVSGFSDLSSLWKSQLATVGPFVLARAEVAVELGLGIGVVVGALGALRRSSPQPPNREQRDPRWLERLVGDLDDEAVSVECTRMVADEVIPIALADLAVRAAPVAPVLSRGALTFVVLAEDQVGSHSWSIIAGTSGLRVRRGTPAPVLVELRTTFPAFLQLLAGSRTLAASVAAGRLEVIGDGAITAAVEPYLAPDAATTRPVATV